MPLTFTAGSPELLIAFSTARFSEPVFDAPLVECHDRAVARHFSPELIALAAIGEARPEGGTSLTLAENDIVTYRAFKGMRKRLQG